MKANFLLVTMLIPAIFAGCSKEPRRIMDEGDPTYMSVSITFPKAGQDTRAAHDPNATDAEVAIKAVDIFIYNENGHFLTHHPMNISLFNPAPGTEDRYVSTEQIKTTTGKKIVYAGINLPQSVVMAVKNQHMGRLSDYSHTFSMADLTTLANGLPMFSVQGVNRTFVEDADDPQNKVSIDVKRMVAKVTVEKSASLSVDGVPGTLGPIEIAVNNFNRQMYLQQGAAPEYKDPNWTSGEYAASDYADTPAAGYVAAHDLAVNPAPTVNDYNILYASENTSEGKLKREITRVTVRSTFMPNNVTVVDTDPDDPDGYKEEPRPASITSPETFYAVTPGAGQYTRYFYDMAVALKYAAAAGGTVVTYTDGLCYWDMFLNKGSGVNQWDVLRNDYYKCTITKIVAPGKEKPDVTDPNIPPDTDTSISVDINILFWTPVSADYVLQP